jgi:hypothetical protein
MCVVAPFFTFLVASNALQCSLLQTWETSAPMALLS